MNIKHITILLFSLFFSCSINEKTDTELLEKDKRTLIQNLDSDKVTSYKFAKILIRASAVKDSTFYAKEEHRIEAEHFEDFMASLENATSKIEKLKHHEELSILDYISLYRDYKKIQYSIMKMDEDIYPTLVESLNEIYSDIPNNKPRLKGIEKKKSEAFEHAFLSAIVLLSKDLGKEISLYECSKTQPNFLPDSEFKTLIQFFRGFIFFEKQLFYLSEDEISQNINWLNTNKDVDFSLTRSMFGWGNLNNEQTHIAFHSINHLFRAFDRLMMERDVDEERALEDFEHFLADSKKLGLSNEIIWSVEAYLYLKTEEHQKAIASLEKLKMSRFLSNKDRENIEESIRHLNQRESGKALNGLYDKYFLTKIASKYVLSIISSVDWKTVLKEQNIPHSTEISNNIERLDIFTANLKKYTSTEHLMETGKDIKDTTKSLWNKTKKMLDDEKTDNNN